MINQTKKSPVTRKLPQASAKTSFTKRQLAVAALGLVMLVGLILLALRLLGWGDGIHEIRGRVLRDGKPIQMSDCRIVFSIMDKGIFVPAKFDSEGNYRVRTPKGYGLPADTYDVYVSFPPDYLPPTAGPMKALPPEELEERLSEFIPWKYRSPGRSGMKLTLTKDEVFDLDMKD